MTKVEELREKVIDLLTDQNMPVSMEYAKELVADLISAAHAEGVAEERERIRKAVIEELHDPDYNTDIIPASVLAPKNEGDWDLAKRSCGTGRPLPEGVSPMLILNANPPFPKEKP
jgi:hypothetical protein